MVFIVAFVLILILWRIVKPSITSKIPDNTGDNQTQVNELIQQMDNMMLAIKDRDHQLMEFGSKNKLLEHQNKYLMNVLDRSLSLTQELLRKEGVSDPLIDFTVSHLQRADVVIGDSYTHRFRFDFDSNGKIKKSSFT